MKNYTLTIVFLIPFLSACGSSGGSGGVSLNNGGNFNSSRPVIIDTYDPVKGPIVATPDDEIYTKDLNNSGSEEVVIAGRSSQPFDMDTDDVSDWQNYEMQVFGWNTGKFGNETASWFRNGENSILGSEPSVHFADFDGDGNTDMAVPHGTDMDLYGPSHVYFNTGSSSFERESIEHQNTWAHDAAVADFNNDGFDDFLVGSFRGNMSLAFGSADQTFDLYQAKTSPVGIGIAVGDFLNNDTVTIVTTGGSDNQELYSWSTDDDDLVFSRESNLPDSRFELSKWDDERAEQEYEYHTIRAITFDFDNNGIDDVVTISTLDKDENVHGYTEVQFLQNDGSGNFTDVTDDVLKGFNTNQIAPYNPVLVDVNNDGLLDIMLSSAAFADEPSTSILLQDTDGTFREEFTDEFAVYNDTLQSLNGGDGVTDPVHSIVLGPNDKRYLASIAMINDGDYQNRVFLSEIGNDGTITVANTLAALKSQWPWISDTQAQNILSLTSSGIVDGMSIIDQRKVMTPIGRLSLKTKSGKRFDTLSGHVSGVDLPSNVAVLAKDNVSRTFSVNLGPSVYSTSNEWNSHINKPQSNLTNYAVRSANLVGGSNLSFLGASVQQSDSDLENYSVSFPSLQVGENIFLTAAFTEVNFSPWLSISGMWGNVTKSNITEGTLTLKKENWTTNIGMMHTNTDIDAGLISSVNNIYAAWADIGWQQKDNEFGLFTGVDPVIVSGSVTVSLPESVDDKGNLIYNKSTVPLISEENFYIRAFFNKDIYNNFGMKTSAVLRNSGKTNISVDFEWDF